MKLTPPWDAEKAFRAQLPPWQMHYAADDYVDYTWHAPTVRLYVGRPTLQPPAAGYRYPEWVRHAMGGVPDCIDPMWHRAAEVIATTALLPSHFLSSLPAVEHLQSNNPFCLAGFWVYLKDHPVDRCG